MCTGKTKPNHCSNLSKKTLHTSILQQICQGMETLNEIKANDIKK